MHHQEQKEQKPLGITLIALYSGLVGLVSVPVGWTTAFASALPGAGAAYSIIGFFVFGLGVLFLAAAYGLWTLQSWGRIYSWWLYLVSIPLGIIAIFPLLPGQQMSAGNAVLQLLGIAIGIAILVYLARPELARLFESAQHHDSFAEYARREPQ